MENLYCIVYVSTASSIMTDNQLQTLLTAAIKFNNLKHVTGVLLYNDGNFFQYIEGAKSALELVYSRIKNSQEHGDIIELLNQEISARVFPNWQMGLFHPTKSELLNISNQNWWNTANQSILASNQQPEGIKLLEIFCNSSRNYYSGPIFGIVQ